MTQQTLFDLPAPADPEPGRRLTLQERFERFHARHPDVYGHFKRIALQLRAAGREHYGAKGIMETVRFFVATSSNATCEEFKINNSFTSRYARLLVEEHPEFAGFFEMRRLRAE